MQQDARHVQGLTYGFRQQRLRQRAEGRDSGDRVPRAVTAVYELSSECAMAGPHLRSGSRRYVDSVVMCSARVDGAGHPLGPRATRGAAILFQIKSRRKRPPPPDPALAPRTRTRAPPTPHTTHKPAREALHSRLSAPHTDPQPHPQSHGPAARRSTKPTVMRAAKPKGQRAPRPTDLQSALRAKRSPAPLLSLSSVALRNPVSVHGSLILTRSLVRGFPWSSSA